MGWPADAWDYSNAGAAMIGDMKSLINAANGKFTPRTLPRAEEPDVVTPYREAYQRQAEALMSPSSPNRPAGYTPPGLAIPATRTYANLLAGYRPSPQGLSSKGKYGGFMTAADRDAAIAGAAMEFSSGAPAQLRAGAAKRYEDVEKLRSGSQGELIKTYVTDRGIGRSPRAFEEISQYRAPGLRDYAKQMADWYTQNVKPAEEFLMTAQQIEGTPVSALASSIASQSYGMNPQLAMGKFAGLDSVAFQRKRDEEFMKQYGVPYEQYQYNRQMQQQGTEDLRTSIQSLTGSPASQLIDMSGMDEQTIYSTLQKPDVRLSSGETMSAQDLIGEAMGYLQQGDNDSRAAINNLLDDLQSSGEYDVANLINAILGNMARKQTRASGYRQNYFLNP